MTSGISLSFMRFIQHSSYKLGRHSNVTLTSQAMIGQSVFELQQRKSTLF